MPQAASKHAGDPAMMIEVTNRDHRTHHTAHRGRRTSRTPHPSPHDAPLHRASTLLCFVAKESDTKLELAAWLRAARLRAAGCGLAACAA